jgi:hypothetical protein
VEIVGHFDRLRAGWPVTERAGRSQPKLIVNREIVEMACLGLQVALCNEGETFSHEQLGAEDGIIDV